ncbi:hypothetical protein OQA88_4809 [Cercophora sp. LCS_1]
MDPLIPVIYMPQAAARTEHPKPRQVWTPDEDRILSSAVARETPRNGTISWHKVAAYLPGRNNKDCRKRWYYSVSHTIKKGSWDKEEDEKLIEAVAKYGPRWSRVAAVVGSRNGDQCWKRWYDCLDPRIDKSPWTKEEDAMLANEVATNGRNWSEIVSKHFPNRTSLAAKNRYSVLERRRVAPTKKPSSHQEPLPVIAPAADSSTPSISVTGFDAVKTEHLCQSPASCDFWLPDTSTSGASTPSFISDLEWNALSPASSTLLSSSPAQGLSSNFTSITYSSSPSSAGMFQEYDFNDLNDYYADNNNTGIYTGGQNLMDMTSAQGTMSTVVRNSSCQTMGSEFLYPYYGTWGS